MRIVDDDGNEFALHRRKLRWLRGTAHIVVADERLAWEIHRAVRGGDHATFERHAREHSVVPGMTENGGVDYSGGGYRDEIEGALASLRPNQVSEPIETPYGWHIVQRRRHRLVFR